MAIGHLAVRQAGASLGTFDKFIKRCLLFGVICDLGARVPKIEFILHCIVIALCSVISHRGNNVMLGLYL